MLPLVVVLSIIGALVLGYVYLFIRHRLFLRGLKDNNIPLVQHLSRKVIIPEVIQSEPEKKREAFTANRINKAINRSRNQTQKRKRSKSGKLFKTPADLRRAMVLTFIFGKRKNT